MASSVPGSALSGAVFLIWADALARVMLAPEDIPIGIVTGLCGGAFLYLDDDEAALTFESVHFAQDADFGCLK